MISDNLELHISPSKNKSRSPAKILIGSEDEDELYATPTTSDDRQNLLDDSPSSPQNISLVDPACDHPPTGYFRTFVNFIKGNLGTGILAMPDAIKNAGLFVGTFGLVCIGLLSTYCCHQLLRAYRQVSADRALSYAQVVDLVFRKSSAPRFRRLAKPARFLIDAVLVSTQIGYCSVYILFCSRMVKEVVDSYQQTLEQHYTIRFYETVITALLIPYCFVTTLKALSFFTTIANFLTISCILIVMQYVFSHLQPISDVPWYPKSIESLPLFFGTAMFTFESIALILPIENRMQDRQRFHGRFGLLSISMLSIIASYATVGFFGYLAFGENSQMILSNMPPGMPIYQAVKLAYVLCIIISFNLQLYVPVQIIMPSLKRKFTAKWFDRWGEYIVRSILVLTTYFLALNIPCLEQMISLFGAFASSWLALILPPVIEIVSCYHPGQMHRLTWMFWLKNGAILAFGLFGCVVGTIMALKSIADAMTRPGGCSF